MADLIAQGNQAEAEGRLEEACALYREAARREPRAPAPHVNLGIALEALGDAAAAAAAFERALALDPASAPAGYNLARLRYAAGAAGAAERLLREALRSRPDFPDARFVLALALIAQGRAAEAQPELEAVLAARPDAMAGAALADVLLARGELAGAAARLEAALALRPDWVEARYNLGTTLMSLGREAQAEAALRRVVELDPGFLPVYRMLGSLLHKQGRVKEALELFGGARERHPGDLDLASFELFLLNFSDDIGAGELFERHRAFGARLERERPARFAFAPRGARRLRIGYVSSELNYHPVGLFLLPVLERHDRARFEVHCYSTSAKTDDFTRRLRAAAERWHDVAAAPDAALADAIHAEGIDLLVDLAGHSGIPRPGVFAEQPAPVQAAWLGYLNTTGLTRIHYRITDARADPPGAEAAHTEALARLPHSQWCYRPFLEVPHAAAPPLARNPAPTFGSFGQAAKLSGLTRRLWAEILRGLPGARLLVAGVAPGRAAEDLRRDLAQAGVAPERVTLAPFLPLAQYYALFDQVDIALDPQPYSGGTTTCDALWMGVPVLTFPGERPVSRSAASLLSTLGLTDWIAAGPEDYVRRALALAGQREALAALRRGLRARMRASPLMDEARFTRDLEAAYLEMSSRAQT